MYQLCRTPTVTNFFASPPLHSFHVLSAVKYPHPIPLFLFPFLLSHQVYSINQSIKSHRRTNKQTNNLTAEYLRYDNIQFIRSTSGTTYTHTQRKKNKKKKKGGKIARPSHHAPCLIIKIKTPVPTCVREPQLNSAQLNLEKKRGIRFLPSFLSYLPMGKAS